MFGLSEESITGWASKHVPGFDSDTLRHTRDSAVPFSVMESEMAEAVRSMQPVPVYFGLELVSHPGVIEITPTLVNEMVHAGREAQAAGCYHLVGSDARSHERHRGAGGGCLRRCTRTAA